MLGKFRLFLLMVCVPLMVLAVPAIASADNITNDVGAGAVVSVASGQAVTVGFRVGQKNRDNEKGCNVSAASPAVVTIMAPPQVKVEPSTLTFDKCRDFELATFASNVQGEYQVSVDVHDSGPGSYRDDPAMFTLRVLPAPNPEAPEVHVAFPTAPATTNRWFVTKPVTGTISATDPDGISGIACVGADVANLARLDAHTVSADIVVSNEGFTFVSCMATDARGNAGITKESVYTARVQIDTQGPVITPTPEREPDANEWYNHPLSVEFSGDDEASGVASCDVPASYAGPDNANALLTVTCQDAAGNAGTGRFGFKYDATAPRVTATPDRGPDFAGGYTRPVTVTFAGTDALSGGATCTAPATYAGPATRAGSLTGNCSDQAGNMGQATFTFSYLYQVLLPLLRR